MPVSVFSLYFMYSYFAFHFSGTILLAKIRAVLSDWKGPAFFTVVVYQCSVETVEET